MRAEIHDQAIECAKLYLKAERNLFSILLEVDRNKIYEDFEYTHLTPYCVKKLGLSEDIVKCLVRVVRKTLQVPELGEAVTNGEISIYKARVITSAITPENAKEWLAKARILSKSKLEKEVAEARGIPTKKATLNLPHETHELLERVRDVISTKQAEFVSFEQAINVMAEDYLHRHDPVEKAKRSRDPSAKQQTAMRDEGRCQFIYQDGGQCDERKWTHQHHVIHRADGGPDTPENLITLCASHHRMVHRNPVH